MTQECNTTINSSSVGIIIRIQSTPFMLVVVVACEVWSAELSGRELSGVSNVSSERHSWSRECAACA